MRINNNIAFIFSIIILLIFNNCKQDEVTFSASGNLFSAIQIQKFDYGQRIGVGKIIQGRYSANKDTVYFDVTYFPDEAKPTYQDWMIQGSLFQGATVVPGLSGVKDLVDPLHLTVYAPDGVTAKSLTVSTKIYEVPFAELEKGFGRYNKLWNKTAEALGGWVANAQTSLAVVGDELIVNNRSSAMLVYDKRTGAKKERAVALPTGNTAPLFAITVDNNQVLHAATFVNTFSTSKFRIFRWTNGIDQEPEVFMEIDASVVPSTQNTGMGRTFSICGSTSGDAQMMIALDGYGAIENRIVRIPVVGGVPSLSPDVFNTTVDWTWRGLGIAASPTGKTPYFAASLGNPVGLAYYDTAGEHRFVTAASGSNFLNKIAVINAYYFVFNNTKYLAASTTSWPGDLRMLIFNIDDVSLIPTSKAEDLEKYSILNPFSENWDFTGADNGNGTGDITVQVQNDGKTALVYMLDTNSGILAYELTNVGASSK